jgi:hypothetical protein
MAKSAVFAGFVLLLSLSGMAADKNSYQAGKLVDITSSSSSRPVAVTAPTGGGTSTVVNVEDVQWLISVQVDQLIYVGEYYPRTKFSYEPKDWIVNDPIEVRMEKDHMILRRPDGKELKTKIVKRVRIQSQ